MIIKEKKDKTIKSIKSFVIRNSRTTKSQKTAIKLYRSLYMVDFKKEKFDIQSLYPTKQPLIIEIGFGTGTSLIADSERKLNNNFLGIEVHKPGIGRILKSIHKKNIKNLLIIEHDAKEVLSSMIIDETIAGFQIFFPDPWNKKRHRKRRLINQNFIQILEKKSTFDSFIHFCTDCKEYAEDVLTLIEKSKVFVNKLGGFATIKDRRNRPETKFEKIAKNKPTSETIWDIIAHKAL